MPTPLPRLFTYAHADTVASGSRVRIPFGPRAVIGVVVGEVAQPDLDLKKIKSIKEVVDQEPIFGEDLLRLAHWMSEYYIYPIGEIFRTMLPGGSVASKSEHFTLTERARELGASPCSDELTMLLELFQKRTSLAGPTLRKKLKARDIEVSATLKAWQKYGWISISAWWRE